MLFFSCVFLLGSYFCYDIPGPIQVDVTDKKTGTFPGMSDTEYNLQYTVYSYPNMILPLFGGIFLDVLGFR